jgi:hypothetical protein
MTGLEAAPNMLPALRWAQILKKFGTAFMVRSPLGCRLTRIARRGFHRLGLVPAVFFCQAVVEGGANMRE